MVKLVTKGEWKKTSNWLQKVMMPNRYRNILRTYGEKGVNSLRDNTPILSGVTAESWYYDVEEEKKGQWTITWANSNMAEEWFNVALYIQLGHATVDGRWIDGIDYINPALAPVFNDAANRVWNEYDQNP